MKNLIIKYKELISYIIFGVLTTVVSWGSYIVFVDKLHMSVTVGNILSWICAVTFAYVTNKLWVFESKNWKPSIAIKEFFGFIAARLATGVLQFVCVPLLANHGFDNIFYTIVEKLNINIDILFTDGIYSKIFIEVFVIILNYFLSKFLIFTKKKNKD